MIYVAAELPELTMVGSVEITAGPNGISGDVAIETTSDGETWLPVPAAINTAPYAVSDVPIDTAVTAVRIVIANPGALETTGGIGEFHLYP